jgi:hypothetical protein
MSRLFFCILLCGVILPADELTKAQKIEEYLRLTKVDESLKQALDLNYKQIKSGLLQQIFGVNLNASQQKQIDELTTELNQLVGEGLSWEKLKPEYVKLMAEMFSEEELDDLLQFYRSKTGKALIAKSPEMMTKASSISQKRMAEMTPQIQKLMKDFAGKALEGNQKP